MISKETVEYISKLARIELTEDEKKRFGDELAAILDFIGALNEIDTLGVAPMTGGTREENRFRPDETISDVLEGAGTDLTSAAPGKKNGYVSVPSIFE